MKGIVAIVAVAITAVVLVGCAGGKEQTRYNVDQRDSMMYVPALVEGRSILKCGSGTSGTDGYDNSITYELLTHADEQVILRVTKSDDSKGGVYSDQTYYAPSSLVEECYKLIYEYNFAGWKDMEDLDCIDGGFTYVTFADDIYTVLYDNLNEDKITYTTVSTDAMPEKGEQQMYSVFNTIERSHDDWTEIDA